MKERVSIIGAGAAGNVIGRLLREAGYKILKVASRSKGSSRSAVRFIGAGEAVDSAEEAAEGAGLIFVTTPDDVLAEVCEKIANGKKVSRGAVVIHCSGVLSSEVLSPVRDCGAHVGSIHPLKSLAKIQQAVESFAGTFCGYEGDQEAIPSLLEVIKDIGGIPLKVRGNFKPLYHAGAVFSCNYVVTLVDIGQRLLMASGVPEDEARRALGLLLEGTLKNIARYGVPEALTGPIERGDIGTVKGHLEYLKEYDQRLYRLYSYLGGLTIDIALRKGGIGPQKVGMLREVLGI
jgi:predicted short-subunit dehydrogenase-like oxidoreductase (DUF2520 family)